ncbi:MAG: ATP-binding protein [Candidatus Neomarinimicrobiota bacterium]
MPERKPINVAVSVLADISLGIYRTPANALKELISNAFDADATRVIINTGFPYFRTITCRDNGDGMSSKDFEKIMDLIGGSVKRKDGRQYTDKTRPLIGKIGIGILAVAQICKRFTIVSSTRNSCTKFEAHVDFKGLNTESAKEIPLGSKKAKKIGSYVLFKDLPEELDAHYTKIILENIEPGFRNRLLETGGPESKIQGYRFKKGDPKVLPEFIKWLATTNARDIPDYYRLLWELSITCPISYLQNGPIKGEDIISGTKKALLDFDFTVKIDGLELRKLILFPTSSEVKEQGKDYLTYTIEFDEKIDGSRLAFKGYIYHQRISIQPPELRGLLIRVRNVAIGMYDKSLLNYPKAQGPRMAGISGEIYVDDGLESALNIDRNSFRETDPHYLKLQEVIYTRLGGDKEKKTSGIFSDISRMSAARNLAKKEIEDDQSRDKIKSQIKKLLGRSFEISTSKEESSFPIEVDIDRGAITVHEQHPIFPRAKAARSNIERILIAYEFANKIGNTKEGIRNEFYRILMES